MWCGCVWRRASDWKRERELGAKKPPNTIAEGSKIQLQEVQVASKIESGGFQRSRAAKKRLLKASGTLEDASRLPFRGAFGRPEPFKTHKGSTAKKELNSKCVLERILGVSETDFKWFCKVSAS